MIVRPSIAFNDFSGTASEVTARNVSGRNILSVRAKQAKTYTPSQAKSRNRLSSISRAFKQLTKSQMAAWEVLAGHLKGLSLLGSAAELTAHNAFVRINENRMMAGMPILNDAPSYLLDTIQEVELEDFWVTPTFGCFTGIVTPKDTYRLFVKMSGGKSNGVSNGWSRTVIVAPGVQEDWGEAVVTKLYAETIGYSPKLGEKVFIEMWWMDSETGFTGEVISLAATCKTESQVEGEAYARRNQISLSDITINERYNYVSFDRFNIETAQGSALLIGDFKTKSTSGTINGVRGKMAELPDTFVASHAFFPGRDISGQKPWAVTLYSCNVLLYPTNKSWELIHSAGALVADSEIFGTSAFVNF